MEKVRGTREKVGGTREEGGGTRDQGISLFTVKITAKHEPTGTAHEYFKVHVLFKQMQRTLFWPLVMLLYIKMTRRKSSIRI